MELLPLKPISSNFIFRRSLLADMTWLESFLRKNLAMTLHCSWAMTCLNIAREDRTTNFAKEFEYFGFQVLVWNITRNACNFQTLPSWILSIRPALSFHINYSLVKECGDLLDYINFGFKLNKIFNELRNFL